MIVYHGSTEIIKTPQIGFSKKYLDFGEGFYVTTFQNQAEKWLDFVCGGRRGEKFNQGYDVVFGNVADDDVFKTVDMYFRGLWDKEKTLNELRYYQQNNQFCFVTQSAIDSLLKYNRSYEVKVD